MNIAYLFIIAALVFNPQQQQESKHRNIHIVFVQPYGETFSQYEQDTAIQHIENATRYWSQLSPIVTEFSIDYTAEFIEAPEDIFMYFGTLMYINGKTRLDYAGTYVYVIDNSISGTTLNNEADGYADVYSVWVTTSSFESTYAHELGHNVYDLPHQYQESVDIMNLIPDVAYQRHTIGCASLRELGKECYNVYVPVVQ